MISQAACPAHQKIHFLDALLNAMTILLRNPLNDWTEFITLQFVQKKP